MNENPLIISIMVGCALLGFLGVFVASRLARDVLWVLAVPPFCFGVMCVLQLWMSTDVRGDWLVLCAVAFFWPAAGCLIGEHTSRRHSPGKVFSDFFVATDDAAVSYDSAPGMFHDRVEHRGIGTKELSTLWTVLCRARGEATLGVDFLCLLRKADDTRSIYRLPEEMQQDLARLTHARLAAVTAGLSSEQGWGWGAGQCRQVVADLARLARSAVDSGRNVYLWNCEDAGELNLRLLLRVKPDLD